MRRPTTIRIPEATKKELDSIVRHTRRDFSSIVNEMLEESVRMRRFPGILFADGPSGRRARIAGTGLDVFEIVAAHQADREDLDSLRRHFSSLSEVQLRSALAYYQSYPGEIDERLDLEASWNTQQVHHRYPFMAPPCAST